MNWLLRLFNGEKPEREHRENDEARQEAKDALRQARQVLGVKADAQTHDAFADAELEMRNGRQR